MLATMTKQMITNVDDGDDRKMPAVAEPSSIDGTAGADASAAASAMIVDDGSTLSFESSLTTDSAAS